MLELKNITKVYEAGTTQVEALKGITSACRENGCGALLGPAGCGRTARLSSLGGRGRGAAGHDQNQVIAFKCCDVHSDLAESAKWNDLY